MIKRFIFSFLLLCLVWNGTTNAAAAPDTIFPVDQFKVDYARADVRSLKPMQEILSQIQNVKFQLGSELGKDGKVIYTEYTGGGATYFTLATLSKGGTKQFRESAIRAIDEAIRKFINDKGFVVVQVQPNTDEVSSRVGDPNPDFQG